MSVMSIRNFRVEVEGKAIVKGIDLELSKGEVTAIMGPNGSGKSTFASALMGHPKMNAKGKAILDGKEILGLSPDERSRLGLFLSFQYPAEIPGVTISNFLRTALNSRRKDPIRIPEYVRMLNEKMKALNIPKEFASRYVNAGFSGGEKKKMEILQLAMLNPKVAILDETDSGLDIDALKQVCKGIHDVRKLNPDMAILVITHYQRMLDYLKPDKVCIMLDGRIVKKGGGELARRLEESGYEAFKQ